MNKKELHPSGDTIIFTDRYHQYKSLLQPTKKFTSGTKFLNKFFGKFDSKSISKRYGAKHNMEPALVRNMWKRKGEIGREVGNIVHWYLEQKLLDLPLLPHNEVILRHPDPEIQRAAMIKLPHADAAFEEFTARYEFIRAELIVASLKHFVAGMIDILCRNRETNRICFADWKSNAKIDYTNIWQSGLGVLMHLDDCSYQKYRIQLNLYEHIAVTEGYLTGDDVIDIERVVIHIKNDGYDFIPCPDAQDEIRLMFDS